MLLPVSIKETNILMHNSCKYKFMGTLIISAAILPGLAFAQSSDVSAKAYVLIDSDTKLVVAAENPDLPWTAASLTKLVTALVVLDTKPNLSKSVTMTRSDQTVGQCSHGGVCIKSATGVKFTVEDLFNATIIKSANNAANALARSTGLSQAQFVKRMNAKAKALGATHSRFYEPTGMNPKNKITAADYGKIVATAFENPYLSAISQKSNYTLVSTNNSNYDQTIKNSNPLLTSSEVDLVGSKTGYLHESRYNLATVLKSNGKQFIVVVLGEPHMYTAYADTKFLATLLSPKNLVVAVNPIP
ncbi:MAG: serine hydrolase [Candidatus Doudnabacteria bacterium]|nr:serine hydrolase [Candidatus Doudnabacteria bacterium]